MRGFNNSIGRIRVVANALSELHEKTVFVGGATVSLYVTDSAAADPRPTDDVDIIVEIVSYADFSLFEEKLRDIGFQNDSSSKVICRYKLKGITVDIMPIDSSVLGFSNSWYKEGIKNTEEVIIDENTKILIFKTPYFLASKIAAMRNRGMSDLRYSSDFEDIIYLFENRAELFDELVSANHNVKQYLQDEIKNLLKMPIIQEAIESNVEQSFVSARTSRIVELWERFVNS